MRARLKPVIKQQSQSILVKNDKMKSFYAPHHYHPDYEIIYIKKSYGLRVIGNNIGNYYPGEVLILGPGLPHYHEVGNVEEDDETPIETIAVLFPESIFKANAVFPEFQTALKQLEHIKYGISLTKKTKQEVQQVLEQMTLSPSLTNLLSIYSILEILCASDSSFDKLSTMRYDNKKLYKDKMQVVQEYLKEHYLENIQLSDLAKTVGMSKTSFCNFFKTQTGYTFSHYLNALRITKASELLVTTKRKIADIAFEVGFENLSYFNRRFREIKGLTPKMFRQDPSKSMV